MRVFETERFFKKAFCTVALTAGRMNNEAKLFLARIFDCANIFVKNCANIFVKIVPIFL